MNNIRKYIDDTYYEKMAKSSLPYSDNYFLPSMSWHKDCNSFNKFVNQNYNRCLKSYRVKSLDSTNVKDCEKEFEESRTNVDNVFSENSNKLFNILKNVVEGLFELPKNFSFTNEIDVANKELRYKKNNKLDDSLSSKKDDREIVYKLIVNACPYVLCKEIYKYESELDEISIDLYDDIRKVLSYNLFSIYAYPENYIKFPKLNWDYFMDDEGHIKVYVDTNDFFNCYLSMICSITCWILNCDKNDIFLNSNEYKFGIIATTEIIHGTKEPLLGIFKKLKNYSDEDLSTYISEIIIK